MGLFKWLLKKSVQRDIRDACDTLDQIERAHRSYPETVAAYTEHITRLKRQLRGLEEQPKRSWRLPSLPNVAAREQPAIERRPQRVAEQPRLILVEQDRRHG